jgi:hypothetical protein
MFHNNLTNNNGKCGNAPKVKMITVEDLPMVTHIFFQPEKKVNSDIHAVISREGEPISYYTVKNTDKKLHCNAQNGALIIVLPAMISKDTIIEFDREDESKNHLVTIQAESGSINNREKIYLRPKTTDGSIARKYSKLRLIKTPEANEWKILD